MIKLGRDPFCVRLGNFKLTFKIIMIVVHDIGKIQEQNYSFNLKITNLF